MLCIVLSSLPAMPAIARDAIFSQIFASSTYLNPAFAGVHKHSALNMQYRNHPMPDAAGMSTLFAAFDTFQPAIRGGLAFQVFADNQGDLLTENHLAGIYAYHAQLTPNWHASFAAQAGYYRRDLRWDQLEFINPNEPPPDETLVHAADFAAGVMIFNEHYYGGVAAHHLGQPDISLHARESLERKYTAHLGMYLEPRSRRVHDKPFDYFLSPNLIYQHQGESNRLMAGVYGGVASLMAGLWFRHDFHKPNTLIFLVGLKVNAIRVGYSYDHSLSGFTDAWHAAHEISISWSFASANQKRHQRIIRCPNF